MRTMSGSPCLHYDCSNRNSFGYCKTTACINERYQQEQWAQGTNCQICDAFIPIASGRDSYPRICDECKKRLKELLYPKEAE